jgi:hypothetical protein
MVGLQGFSYIDIDLLSAAPDHDLAAARLTENVLATLDTATPREGSPLAVSGYPFAMNSLITNSGCLACAFFPTFADDPDPVPPKPEPDERGVRMVEIVTPGPPSANQFLADLEVNGGNSGGPVYLIETGAVIGVCIATRTAAVTRGGEPAVLEGQMLGYSSGLTVVVPAVYVAAMLRERRVSS